MHQSEVFVVRSGTVDLGKEYEQAVVAKAALELTIDNTVVNFTLSSNDDNFGSFDDVVVEVTTTTGTENFALQLKHLDNGKSKGLWINELNKLKGNFALQKYFDTYKELMTKNITNYKFILYTNIDFPFDVNEEFDVKIDSNTFTVKISESEVYSLFKSSETSKCHKFKVISPDLNIIYKNFFENFFIYSKQGSVKQVKSKISESMNSIIPTGDKYLLKYLDFIGEWAKQKGQKSKLTKYMMQNVLTLNFIFDDIHSIDFQNHSNLDLFQRIVSKFNYVIFNKEYLKSVQSIWSNLKSIPLDSKVIKAYQLYKEKDEDLIKSIFFWITQKSPLIVELNTNTVKVIETFKPSNCILIESGSELKLSPGVDYFQKLSDLEKHSDLYTEVTQALKCTISEYSFSLEYLINCDKNFKETLTTNDLLKMSLGKYKIKDSEHKFPTMYVTRYFKRNFIDVKFLTDSRLAKLFFISNAKNKTQIQRFLAKNVHFTHLIDAKKQFFELVQKESNYEEFHHLRFVEDDLLEWVESVNGISGIQQYLIDGRSSLNEDTFCKQLECEANIKLICDEPGMGKTWLLKNLKNNLASKYWTVFLSSAEIDEFCNQSPKPKTKQDLIAFLLDTKYKNFNTTQKNIISIVLKNNTPKITYFWDALDEIESQQVDIVTQVIKNICSFDKDSLHLVTSRKHLKHKLEEEFCVLAQSLSQFDTQEQKEYLKERLSSNEEEKKNLIEDILKYFDFIKGNDFLGIPLQIYMLTELFQNDSSKYSQLLKNRIVLTELYDFFFEEKLKASYKNNTNGNNSTQPNLDKKDFQMKKSLNYDYYKKMSLKLLFDANSLKKMDINLEDGFSDLVNCVQHVGIMQKDTGTSWRFIHNSYAEYFAACFFVENIEKVRALKEIWFNASNNNVRRFFDLTTAKESQPHLAVLYQNLDFLKSCKDLNCKDDGGRNLVHLACSWGDRYPLLHVRKKGETYLINDWGAETGEKNDSYFEMLNYLLENVRLEQNDVLFGMTEIDYATSCDCLLSIAAVKKALHKEIFDLNDPKYALSLLYYTVSLGYDSFLANQMNLDIIISKTKLESYVKTFINLASHKRHVDTLKILLKYAATHVNLREPLYWACIEGHVETIELLLKQGANCNAANSLGETPLYVACAKGHVKTVELLLNHGANCNAADTNYGNTPLYVACLKGHVETVELLLKRKANCNAATKYGETPLYVACKNDQVETAELLLKHGADCNAANYRGETPLYVACRKGIVKVADLLCKHKAVFIAADKDEFTPLFMACFNGNVKTVNLMLKQGIDCNGVDIERWTPLHWACREGHVEIVKLLLKNRAKCNAANFRGETALYVACKSGHVETAELLLKHGANCNAASNYLEHTPLYVACEKGHVETVELLLKYGANSNAATKYGETPFYVACEKGHVEIAELLLKHGADCNAVNYRGETPLYLACEKGHLETVKLLLKHGANCNAADKFGRTPLQIASKFGHSKIVDLLY